jgi:hypothetical protein
MMSLARVALAALSATIAYKAGAQAPADSTHRDSGNTAAAIATPAATAPAVGIIEAAPPMPSEIRGYHLTDSLRIPGASQATQYTYTRDQHDRVTVLASPYESGSPLRTQDDTTGMLQNTVDMLRVSLENAYHQGNLSAFRTLSEHSDDVKAAGHKVRGYVLVAGLTHRGAVTLPAVTNPMCPTRDATLSGAIPRMCSNPAADRTFEAFMYYAAYALPERVIRVRADLPIEVAVNEQVPDFTRKLVAALTAAH